MLCPLFNIFLKTGYLPKTLMQSVIVPLVKCKIGDMSDINDYRVIAISTVLSKLFESVTAKEVLLIITFSLLLLLFYFNV